MGHTVKNGLGCKNPVIPNVASGKMGHTVKNGDIC